MTVTLKFQSTGIVPGDGRPVSMQGGSLTVGRGPANDLVLPDPERTLSKNHFVIEDHNGNVVIVDLSTNGTFLNYSKIPLGRTPTPLNNGDVLTAGGYEMVLEIGADLPSFEEMIPPPAQQAGVSPGQSQNAPDPLSLLDDAAPGGDFLDDLLGGDAKGPGQIATPDPMDELLPPLDDDDPFFAKPKDVHQDMGASDPMHNPSPTDAFAAPKAEGGANLIPDDWDDDLLSPAGGSASDPFAAPEPTKPEPAPPPPVKPIPGGQAGGQPSSTPIPKPPAPEAKSPEVQPAVPATGSTENQLAARALLEALEIDDLRIDDTDLPATMGRMGRVMRVMITGLREILMTRTSIKSEFRIEQTMINAGGNNPLKFSISPEQAIEALVKPRVKGYLAAEEATEQALNDIKAHEVAMVTGMEAALKGVLARLDPEVLAQKIEGSGKLGSLLKGKKAQYWEVYEKMYADISDQAENDFHDLFSREFARAYKEQLEKLK